MSKYQMIVYGHDYESNYVEKDKRSLALSELQFSPFFIKRGEVVNINVSGKDNSKLNFYTGIPNVNIQKKYSLYEGDNVITALEDGILSFCNNNNDGSVVVNINSSHQRIPFFKLGETSNSSFKDEIIKYASAKYVLLTNELADIVVTYDSARKYANNPEKLMADLYNALDAENVAGGFVKNGKYDFKLSPNRSLHIESNILYMYATNGHVGFTGESAVNSLLSASEDKWGIWHENGHQRQQHPWTWGGGTGG